MAKLIFDIETSALPLDHFDEAQQEYLFRECEKICDEPARAARHAEIQQQCSLWPFTAQVVCIAMLNADTSRGQVLFTALDYEQPGDEAGPVEFVACVDEIEMLTAFWDVAKHYETVVLLTGGALMCLSSISARPCSTCPSHAKTGSATASKPSLIATWPSS